MGRIIFNIYPKPNIHRRTKNVVQGKAFDCIVNCARKPSYAVFQKHVSQTNFVEILKAGSHESFRIESVAEKYITFSCTCCIIHILIRMPQEYVVISKRISKNVVCAISES